MSFAHRKRTGETAKSKIIKTTIIATTVGTIAFGILFGPKVYETSKKYVIQAKNKVTYTIKNKLENVKEKSDRKEEETTKGSVLEVKDEDKTSEKVKDFEEKLEVKPSEKDEKAASQPVVSAHFDKLTNQIVVDSKILAQQEELTSQKEIIPPQKKIELTGIGNVPQSSLLISPKNVKTALVEKSSKQPHSKTSEQTDLEISEQTDLEIPAQSESQIITEEKVTEDETTNVSENKKDFAELQKPSFLFETDAQTEEKDAEILLSIAKKPELQIQEKEIKLDEQVQPQTKEKEDAEVEEKTELKDDAGVNEKTEVFVESEEAEVKEEASVEENVSDEKSVELPPETPNKLLNFNECNLKMQTIINNINLDKCPQSYYNFSLGRKAYVPSDSKFLMDLMVYVSYDVAQSFEFKPAVAGVDLGFEYKKVWDKDKFTIINGGVGMVNLDSFSGRVGVEHFFNKNFSVLANANYIHNFELDRSNFGVTLAGRYTFGKNNTPDSIFAKNLIDFATNSTNKMQTQGSKPQPQKIEQPETNELPTIIGPADSGRGFDKGREM